ncbi:A disintegrin and metalloproteinase with thrombospondin motifs 9-like isoform X2 [Corticium candelabrum]|uniref:A disintegrin and metalloproteinase with thrombospondin motifs 9-like isoform X2 n=1 Tax=Corticium candelabrum TaxID=121492 RepID=UPI002E26CE04|nr:A disintegrin and metalloproteinase with thrombospondin motifs 9-like isoform X2 [Corticium candelabrum]
MLLFSFFIVSLLSSGVQLSLIGEGSTSDYMYEVVTPRLEVHHRKTRGVSDNNAAQRGDIHMLMYNLNAFGETVRLHLHPNDGFIAASLEVEYHGSNGKRKYESGSGYELRRCFYSGLANSSGAIRSRPAVFSVCGGLSGFYTTDNGQFFVEPLQGKTNGSSTGWLDATNEAHIVYKRKPADSSSSSNTSDCGLQGHLSQDVEKISKTITRRRRSQSMENYVETLLVADEEMYRYHKRRTEHYLLVVSNVVSHLFQDPSLKNFVKVVVVRMVILEENPATLDITDSAHHSLYSFCRWQKDENYPLYHKLHHDIAVLFTRRDICRTSTRCDTLGLAELGTICDPARSCTINEDNGLSVALTAAHELGHILNMPHDGETSDCPITPSQYRLMAPTLSSHTNPWSWSQCSSKALTAFLDGGNGICLLNKPNVDLTQDMSKNLPGQLYNLDKQCEMAFGSGITSCKYIQDEVPCRRLWCSTSSPGCRTRHMPWAEGTPCGNNKWCIKGKCVAKERNTKPIDGQWGNWKSFSSCTRTCGGGVQYSERDCDYPEPANGGQYCVGQRRKYTSCNTQDCPRGSISFRQLQCESFNGQKHNFNNVPYNVKWSAKYNLRPSERCKLFCYTNTDSKYYRLAAKVVDGTPCSPDTFDMCVDGQCRPAGCDHKLGSHAKIDKCGKCNGNGQSCREVVGFLGRAHYGYNDVVTFPVGTTQIIVRQPPILARDDNYLALKQGGSFIFNGDYKINVGRYRYKSLGCEWYYNGSQTGVETLTSKGPLPVPITLLVLSVGVERTLQLSWTFNAPASLVETGYHWTQTDWTACSSDCQGTQKRTVVCRRNDNMNVVPDRLCDADSKPDESQRCNLYCSYEWTVRDTHCSATCGRGSKMKYASCFRRQAGTRALRVSSEHCQALPMPPSRNVTCQLISCVTLSPDQQGQWRGNPWSKCSASCGNGVQQRKVRCVNIKLWKLMADSDCAAIPKPVSRQVCNLGSCANHEYYWNEGQWSSCSKTCGVGVQQRSLRCLDHNGQTVSTSYCSTQGKPRTSRECVKQRCTRWQSRDWTKCSSSCGIGHQTRQVDCVDAADNVVNNKHCSLTFKPLERQNCRLHNCPSGRWQLSAWSACSATCNRGVRVRRVICADEQGNDLGKEGCNGSEKPLAETEVCIMGSCYEWKVSNWSTCSRSCGGGKVQRKVKCQSATGQIVPNAMCQHLSRPIATAVCNQLSCPKWHKGEWTKCSKKCGPGIKYRLVRCAGPFNQYVADSKCNLSKRPVHAKKCQLAHCTDWRIGEWSSCTKSCGMGAQTRSVKCYRKNKLLADSGCAQPAPVTSRSCMNQACPTYLWVVSGWKPCSVTCGKGTTSRTVECVDRATKKSVGSNFCESVSRPRNSDRCQLRTCPGHWDTKPWNQCSVTCGNGVQKRSVDCMSGDHVVSDSYCRSTSKPLGSQQCTNSPCDSVVWVYGSWTSCDKSCGGGIQKRHHYCSYNNNRHTRLSQQLCVQELGEPLRQRPCNVDSCFVELRPLPTSCNEVKTKEIGRSDGTYLISTRNGVLKIYCYEMNTQFPKEFITLLSKTSNYAEIFSKTLRNPNTCPTNLTSSIVNSHPYRGKGRTEFSRVRIDVHSMEIMTNDFTFATKSSPGERTVEYGSAGDCFSNLGTCPMGEFRVDLRSTGLYVDPKHSWQHQGRHSVVKTRAQFNHQVVTGKCGGHCGQCYSFGSRIRVKLV